MATTIDRNAAGIFWAPNTWADNGTARVAVTPTYVTFRFTGTSLAMNIAAITGMDNSYTFPVIRTYIDDMPPVDVQLTSGQTVVSFATALPAGTHTARINLLALNDFQDLWHGGGALRITGFALDDGGTVSTAALRPKRAIMFGNDVAAGLFVATSDPTQSFAALLGEALDAEFGLVAHNVQGFTYSPSWSGVPGFINAYGLILAGASRLTSGQFAEPVDYVIVTHGEQPGYSQGNVATAITNMRAAAPAAEILFFVPVKGYGRTTITAAVNSARAAGDAKVYLIDIGERYQAGFDPFGGATAVSPDGRRLLGITHARVAAAYAREITTALQPRRYNIVPV